MENGTLSSFFIHKPLTLGMSGGMAPAMATRSNVHRWRRGGVSGARNTLTRATRRDVLVAAPVSGLALASPAAASDASIYDFSVQQYGEIVDMSKYKGQVLVIVNVASE